jgi:hypothetical protein
MSTDSYDKNIEMSTPLKNYITYYDLLNNVDLTNTTPVFFNITSKDNIIASSETSTHTWISIVRALWDSMQIKCIINNTTYDLIETSILDENNFIYNRANIHLVFASKNANDAFKQEIMNLVNINKYKIDITIQLNEEKFKGRCIHYTNYTVESLNTT